MKTPDEIIERYAGNRWKAAIEIARRFGERSEFVAAARRWCEVCAADTSAQDYREFGDAAEACFRILDAVCPADAPFRLHWMNRARETVTINGATKQRAIAGVVSALVALWPHRESFDRFEAVLAKWATQSSMWARGDLAVAFCDRPELVHLVLGPAKYSPRIAHGHCSNCGKDHDGVQDEPTLACWLYLQVARERIARRCEPDPIDTVAFDAIPVEHLLSDTFLVMGLHQWPEFPPRVWDAVEHALHSGQWHPWTEAVALLSTSNDAQRRARAVSILASAVASSDSDPLAPFRHFHGRQAGMYLGRGWGRRARREVLLPLTRELLRRGVWPYVWFRGAVDAKERDEPNAVPGVDERASPAELVREILAEALLAEAKDDTLPVESRRQSIQALGLLEPGGDGSWARALRAFDGPLGEDALRAAAQMRERRTGALDPEIAMEDACERRGVRFVTRDPEPVKTESDARSSAS
jgi:hypothetical protein